MCVLFVFGASCAQISAHMRVSACMQMCVNGYLLYNLLGEPAGVDACTSMCLCVRLCVWFKPQMA